MLENILCTGSTVYNHRLETIRLGGAEGTGAAPSASTVYDHRNRRHTERELCRYLIASQAVMKDRTGVERSRG
eukprot:6042284-Pyramimonas_sp.AAC.1